MESLYITESNFKRTQVLLRSLAGIRLREGKEQMVLNRLAKPMQVHGYFKLDEYLNAVEHSKDLGQSFVNALTTNVTSFFREKHHFDHLVNLARSQVQPLRVWSAGCSTGQEPYSIAISLLEACGGNVAPQAGFRVLATDIDTQALDKARCGQFDQTSLKGLPETLVQRYFSQRAENLFEVKPQLKQMVEFRYLNLSECVKPPPWRELDAVFCRNVLIYFDLDLQERIVKWLSSALRSQGFLYAGHSEMLLHSMGRFQSLGRTTYQLRTLE
jgi:chemotaxis protein methyltransferase CheR